MQAETNSWELLSTKKLKAYNTADIKTELFKNTDAVKMALLNGITEGVML